ncbi:hypothetical protein [Halodesulfovibrio sp. MK-HDV]|jgi:hypothetical protein|uniref:hypothetical protein n=1 Tax=Halodesulfovibrio sp. MK-HDV TaxID=2599925 RepID=UPI00136CC7FB|nr:hypothetical protein [Halodesulfovibrio sp. MK-HDV]KAF1076049.1 hypothetical protein MKHDV_01485 [Halodesulfovibrio sp. MK-HDV]
MKSITLLLLLALSASLAYAESIIPISCDDVARTSVNQTLSSDAPIHVKEYPYIYLTGVSLTPEAYDKFHQFYNPNIIEITHPDGTKSELNPIRLSTSTGIVAVDSPYRMHVSGKSLLLIFKTREKALEAAQKICPQIKPEVFFLYDYLEKQRLREKAELSWLDNEN